MAAAASISMLLSFLAAAAPVDFVRDVRPILERHCVECHGPDKQKGNLRLDVRESAFRGGEKGLAIVPHDSKKSRLIQYVSGEDKEIVMPPVKSGKARLDEKEIAVLRAWIDEGPAWPREAAGSAKDLTPHWSLTPLVKPAVPAGTNAIDAFIRAKLVERKLAPSPPADRRTLIRRLSYDLTGLPPTSEETTAFLSDKDPNAYDKLVKRLLASPRYGEHWGRHWLDVANYADTHGNDHDYARPNAWPYRDYVIRAFNDDKPYARFVQEQVAGDVLFPEDPQATIALGFVAAGPWDHTLMVTVRAETVDHQMAQNLDRDGMVSSVMGTFQSLTVHCARCHDHKFDPISQREYYSLQAIFAGVDRAERTVDADEQTASRRKLLLAEQRRLKNRDASLLATLDSPEVAQKVLAWEKTQAADEKAWTPFEIVSIVSTGGSTLSRQSDGSWFAGGTRPDRDTYIVTAHRKAGKLGAVRLEVLPDDRLPEHGPGRWENGNFHLNEFRAFAAPPATNDSGKPLVFSAATADFNEGPAISAAQAIDGNKESHWGIFPRTGKPAAAVFTLKEPANYAEGTTFTFLLENEAGAPGHGIGRFRLSGADTAPLTVRTSGELKSIRDVPVNQRSLAQRQDLALAVLSAQNEESLAALPAPRRVYAIAHDFTPDGGSFTPSPQPRPIHLLTRGDVTKPAELIPPGTLACVPGMPGTLSISDLGDEGMRRAALARWIADERNVLTWRSIVNRVWAYHFGRGLCDTPSDFGKMGGRPSHPELLDYLAIWFRDEAKGSLKELHRLIVTSETWKQSTLADQRALVDADNRSLWRQNRVRMTGEEVRDTLLTLSGKLDLTMGGAPAVQFISRGDATFMPGGNPAFLDYEHFDPDAAAARRRAVYRFIFRTVPDPFLDALDTPDGGATTPVRTVSTTALQALVMLNDPFVIRQSEHMAARLTPTATTPEQQADTAFELILLRRPRDAERGKFAAYIRQHGLADACQLLLNTNEFLYID